MPLHQEKSLPAEAVASAARAVGIPADSFESVEAALAAIGRLDFDPAPRILITGSLYLAGDTLAANGTLPRVTLRCHRRNALDRGAAAGELVLEPLEAAVEVIDAVDHGLALGRERRR